MPQVDLYLYPRFHPHHGESQVDFTAIDTSLYPQLVGKAAAITTLAPGETLFVPPYWFVLPMAVGRVQGPKSSLAWAVEADRSARDHAIG